jgi:hypothetical protein
MTTSWISPARLPGTMNSMRGGSVARPAASIEDPLHDSAETDVAQIGRQAVHLEQPGLWMFGPRPPPFGSPETNWAKARLARTIWPSTLRQPSAAG